VAGPAPRRLLKDETVEIQCLGPEDAFSLDMFMLITGHGRTLGVPLSQLVPLDTDESTGEAIGD
jgi:hypothetical protein